MGREDVRQYGGKQFSERWASYFSIPEYCELEELSCENARRWVRVFKKDPPIECIPPFHSAKVYEKSGKANLKQWNIRAEYLKNSRMVLS